MVEEWKSPYREVIVLFVRVSFVISVSPLTFFSFIYYYLRPTHKLYTYFSTFCLTHSLNILWVLLYTLYFYIWNIHQVNCIWEVHYSLFLPRLSAQTRKKKLENTKGHKNKDKQNYDTVNTVIRIFQRYWQQIERIKSQFLQVCTMSALLLNIFFQPAFLKYAQISLYTDERQSKCRTCKY